MTTPTPADRLAAERIVSDGFGWCQGYSVPMGERSDAIRSIAAALAEQRETEEDARYNQIASINAQAADWHSLSLDECSVRLERIARLCRDWMAEMTGGPTEHNS